MTQETLEEAAKSNYDNKTSRLPLPTTHWINSEFLQIQNFKEGAKWQQEKMYSEEEVIKIVKKNRETGLTAEFLLLTEQFKKK